MRAKHFLLMAFATLFVMNSANAKTHQKQLTEVSNKYEMAGQNIRTQILSDIKKANKQMEEVGGDDFAFDRLSLSGNYLVCTFYFINFGYIGQSDSADFAMGIFRDFSAARRVVQNAYKAGYGFKVVVKTDRGSRTYTYSNKVFLKL